MTVQGPCTDETTANLNTFRGITCAPVQKNRIARLFGKYASSLINRWRTYKEQRINRQAFQNIQKLGDDILDDIGVTRGDIDWVSNLPLSVNAGAELERIKQNRRQTSKTRTRPRRRN